MSHRRLVRWAGLAVAAALLAGCGGPTGTGSPTGSPTPRPSSPAASESVTATPTPTPAPTDASQAAWRLVAADVPDITAREDHTWTPSPDGSTAYLFGGRTSDGMPLADLWAHDLAGGSWRRIEAPGPTARFGHNAAWVDNVGLVIFAGQAGATFFNDLWAFDPAGGSWRQLPGGGDQPVARYGSCAAVGPDGRLWISHGFTADGRRFADTRAYDFASGTWTDETPSGDVPIARCLHGCWWTDDGELALFGGQTTGVLALDDLWHLAPGPRQGTHQWSQITLQGLAPAGRNLYAAARWGDATLIFSGQELGGSYLADLWLLRDDGTAELLAPDGAAPDPRSGAEMVVDERSGRVLLFGGRDADVAMGDLWELTLPRP